MYFITEVFLIHPLVVRIIIIAFLRRMPNIVLMHIIIIIFPSWYDMMSYILLKLLTSAHFIRQIQREIDIGAAT